MVKQCEKMSKPKEMTPEEREKLIQQLQDDIESFVAEKSIEAREKPEEEEKRTIDEIAEDLLNHPAFMKEVDWSKPLSDEVTGLMALKYESENPVARADSYREEGNDLFMKKDYRLAIENYTEGITTKSPDRQQNAVLYTNRAAAQFHLGNYRTAFADCMIARKFKPDHLKAIVRGALCCEKMEKYADTKRWCDAGLMVEEDHKVLSELKKKAKKAEDHQDFTKRKEAFKERKDQKEVRKLLDAIESRHIQLSGMPQTETTARLDPSLVDLDPVHPSSTRVQLDDDGRLHWPVLFLYPEYSQSDFIQRFSENIEFSEHLEVMFGPGVQPAPWDTDRKYTPDRLQIYFEDREETLHPVSKYNSLLEVLKHKKYQVFKGTPAFILLVKDSDFQKEYLKQHR